MPFGPHPFNTSAVNARSAPYWHVTSSRNRQSILEHGLDWRRMAFAPGVAGSPVPEQEGCFLSGAIAPHQLRLARRDVSPDSRPFGFDVR